MDLRDWMRPERGRALLELIDQCPDSCRWREALSLDVDLMREVLSVEDSKRSEWRPRLAEFNLTNYLLLQAVNLLGVHVKGVKPLKGPKTAEDIVRAEQAATAAFSIIAQVTPHALKGGRFDG